MTCLASCHRTINERAAVEKITWSYVSWSAAPNAAGLGHRRGDLRRAAAAGNDAAGGGAAVSGGLGATDRLPVAVTYAACRRSE
jgi:hypothetical protein